MTPRLHPASGGYRAVAGLCLVVSIAGSPLEGQDPGLATTTPGPVADTAALGTGPYATMRTLLEKTIFKVDVLTLEVRLDSAATARIGSLMGTAHAPSALADAIAGEAMAARHARAHIRFERDVALSRFLEGVLRGARVARDADLITDTEYQEISRDLPGWYAFLDGRGIRDGDQMVYRIDGDTLRTVYRTAAGDVLLDQRDHGAFRRRSVLGGYFAPGSEFRRGLIASLFER